MNVLWYIVPLVAIDIEGHDRDISYIPCIEDSPSWSKPSNELQHDKNFIIRHLAENEEIRASLLLAQEHSQAQGKNSRL